MFDATIRRHLRMIESRLDALETPQAQADPAAVPSASPESKGPECLGMDGAAEIEKLRVKVEQLQKRAGEWEQKDVASFEKTIADLREKLARHVSALDDAEEKLAAAETAMPCENCEKAARELESYAATDRTASMALVDVTRERDEARERLATAEILAEQRRVELKVHKQFTKQYNAAVERERDEARADLENYRGKAPDHMYIEANEKLQADLDAANAKVERLRGLVHREECCEGTWDSDVDHYGCCEALRCSLGETGGDDGKTQEEADAKWNTRG